MVSDNYRYIVGFRTKQYYYDENGNVIDHTITSFNKFIYPKGRNKKVLKAYIKKVIQEVINEYPKDDVFVTSICKEEYYRPSQLFKDNELDKIINKYKKNGNR